MRKLRGASIILTLALPLTLVTGCVRDTANDLNPLAQAPTPPPPPATISIKILNYVPATNNTYKDLFVSNFSVKASKGKLLLSTSRDGLTDEFKLAHQLDFGFIPMGPYSNAASFSDLFIYLSGVNVSQQNLLYCAPDKQLSTSNDAFIYDDDRTSPSTPQFLGLKDCEKRYMGLDVTKFDSSKSGIPDYLKLRCGLNPKNLSDSNLSIANDSLTNKEKCKKNIPIDESADLYMNQLFAYQYKIELLPDGSRNFTVSNIPVLNEGIQNFIAFYIVESNISTNASVLYSAYLVLKTASAGKTVSFNYWGTGPLATNQEIVLK